MSATHPSSPTTARLRYAFDNFMAKGTGALILALGVVSLILIVVSAGFIAVTGIAPEGDLNGLAFWEAFWGSLMRTLDAGTMGADTGWGFRMVMFFVTLGGIFIISSLIGVLNTGLEGKFEELRKGRSVVVEKHHFVILGWSSKIYTIIEELIAAHEGQAAPCVVVMSPRDKVEMDDALAERLGDDAHVRIVCRSGNPMDLADLALVALDDAQSIIVLAPEIGAPDPEIIKILLAIINRPERRAEPYHVVAEIQEPKNLSVAKLVGRDEVEFILVADFISRVVAQTCRQSGLSVVYTELMDFGGDEIYFHTEPSLVGNTYRAALHAFDHAAVMGIQPAVGEPLLNPPMDHVLAKGDKIIAIAKDRAAIKYNPGSDKVAADLLVPAVSSDRQPDRILVLGWNRMAPRIISALNDLVAPGSFMKVVSDSGAMDTMLAALRPRLGNMAVEAVEGDTVDRALLDSLDVASYDHLIVNANSDDLEPQQADALTLMTLLHLRDMAQIGGHRFSIVSEMLDLRNRQLAEVSKADDFVVSDRLVSLLIAQIATNKALNAVFGSLLSPEGSEIYLKPATELVVPGRKMNFHAIIEAAARRGETAIGYRVAAQSSKPDASYGVVVNPRKADEVTLAEGDRIIVLAENG